MAPSTSPLVQHRLERLNRVRTALLEETESLPSERLTARPVPGKWNILEIIEHLVLAERYVLANHPEPARLVHRSRGLRDRALYPVVLFVLKVGIPVQAPSRKMLPGGNASLAELRRQWDASYQWICDYVGSLDGAGLRKAVFAHPVTGPLTVAQTLLLGRIHVELHTRQVQRLIRLTNSGPSAPRPETEAPSILPR